jgi:phosphoribosylaminoimidazolecarboxamide formyltransferase/IMP cyclohydrolase
MEGDRVRALLSVANRDGIADLARELVLLGVEIFATDGTRSVLESEGVAVRPIGDLTEMPVLAGGTVKTFHPHVYAGVLARRHVPEDMAGLEAQGIAPIDLVVVNVREFAPQVGAGVLPIDEAVERIEVGGLALLAAAARNFAGVTVACRPSQYEGIVDELQRYGQVSPETRQRLAAEAFAAVAAYEAEVSAYLHHIAGVRFPEQLTLVLRKERDLPYGENPHQRGALYRETTHRSHAVVDATQLQGGPPTFNDLIDLDAAWRMASDFAAPTCCIAKQRIPVGLASNDSLSGAYARALEADPVSAYGAVLAFNRPVDAATATEMMLTPYEGVAAPGYADDARAVLAARPELAVLAVDPETDGGLADYGIADLAFQRIEGGLLVETRDAPDADEGQLTVVTKRRPTLEELTDMLFAWRAVRHVTSNAVVLARNTALVGVGAGQASRLTAVEIALHRAADRAPMSVLASDAYFPFVDAIALAAERGVTAIIQPGGSIRDEMAIEVADRHHVAMVFTGRRHFRH